MGKAKVKVQAATVAGVVPAAQAATAVATGTLRSGMVASGTLHPTGTPHTCKGQRGIIMGALLAMPAGTTVAQALATIRPLRGAHHDICIAVAKGWLTVQGTPVPVSRYVVVPTQQA